MRALWRRLSAAWRADAAAFASMVFAVLMLGLFPLYVDRAGYSEITAAKRSCFLFCCALYGLMLVAAALYNRRQGKLRRALCCLGQPAAACLLLFGLFACLSWLTAPQRAAFTAADGLFYQLLLLASALVLAYCGRWQQGYLTVAATAMLLTSLLAVLQLAGGNPFGLYPPGRGYADGGLYYVGSFLGTVGNIDLLASYSCLILPLLLFGAPLLPWRRRWLLYLAAASGLAVMLASGVSAGPLAVALTCCLFGPLSLPPRWRRRLWLAAAFLLLLLLIAAWLYDGAETGMFWELSRLLHGEVNDSFGSSRVLIWRDALDDAEGMRRWLLGSGPGTRALHFSTLFERVSAAGVPLRAYVTNAHSQYLDLLLENGLAGLLCYLAALVAVAWRCRRRLVVDPALRALAAGLFAYLLQGAFLSAYILTAPLFWLLFGLLLAYLRSCALPQPAV